MHEVLDPTASVSLADSSPLGGTIIIATDGTHDSDDALRTGVGLAREHGVRAEIISVVEAADSIDYEGSTPVDIERTTRLAVVSRDGELTAQRIRTGIADRVQSTITVGSRVDEIVRFAEERGASIIVTGVGSRGVVARLQNRHTVMPLAAVSTIPVLAVPSGGLPDMLG